MWSYYLNLEVPDMRQRVIYWQGRFNREGLRRWAVHPNDLAMVSSLLNDLQREIDAMREHIAKLEGAA
jgi:hypothetical protein